MSHNHDSHHHHHHHGPKNYNFSFGLGILLNIIFVLVEVYYGVLADSIALIADAWHNLSDVISLLLAWGASYLATKAATTTRTYGLKRVTILASLLSSILLLFALGGIAWEAIERFSNPKEVEGTLVMLVAGIGVIINTATALLFVKGQKDDLNLRAAYLHMAADAGVSLGVLIAGGAIYLTGYLWLDPLISLFIVFIVLVSTWKLLKDSINLSIDAVPEHIDIQEIKKYLLDCEKVLEIHDLHIWALSTNQTALSVHLILSHEKSDNVLLLQVQKHLKEHFSVEHTTIQIESSENNFCSLNNPCCI
ncbi:cation transporter [Sulfurimonas sp. MAG313]|nr:cation diffusion facilitator family transporter [Sulfurimonas sp. MAG313]MDF1882265.1 cation transporter [Sulfurimonas sp. MAG313]